MYIIYYCRLCVYMYVLQNLAQYSLVHVRKHLGQCWKLSEQCKVHNFFLNDHDGSNNC